MAVIAYACRSCGAKLRYDPDIRKHVCDYCMSVFDEDAKLELLQEEEKSQEEKEYLESFGGNEYSCPSCGAGIVTDETTAATFCYYCHSPVILTKKISAEFQPDYIIPFQIGREKAEGIFRDWIKKKKFVPKAFYTKDQIEKLSGVYFPYLLFNCDVFFDIDTQGTRESTRRSGNMEYITTTVSQIIRKGTIPIRFLENNALSSANRILSENVVPFNYQEVRPFNASFLAGFMAQKKDIEPESLSPSVEEDIKRRSIDKLLTELREYKNVHIDPGCVQLMNAEWKYTLLPVWTLTYKAMDGKLYYFSINGQSGKVIGELPVDSGKLTLTVIGVSVGLFLLFVLLSYFLF